MPRSESPHLRQPLLYSHHEDDSEQRSSRLQSCTTVLPSDTSLLAQSIATMSSFAVLGLFQSTTGVMLPHIEAFYHLNDIQASACFLAGPFGYVLAAQANHAIHQRFGRRGIAIVGPLAHILSAAIIATHPPFLLVLAGIALAFAGTGLLDGSWCTWAARQEKANFISGLLHGSFSVGAGCAPMLIELVLARDLPWYNWYKILILICFLELALLIFAFKSEDAAKHLEPEPGEALDREIPNSMRVFKYKATWICACFLLIYVGTETAISGWVVTFMLRIRQSSRREANLCSSSFWTGMAVSRMVLGFVSDRFGVKKTTAVYIIGAVVFQTLFVVTVESPILSAVLIALVGFFCGPLFPSAIIRLTQILPRTLGVKAVSFVASVGQLGGALLPFGLGALSHLIGLGVFGIVIIAQLAVCLALWIVFT